MVVLAEHDALFAQALAHWSTLQNSLASQQHISSIRAAEAAAWLIYRLTKVQDTMQMVDEDEIRQQQITMEVMQQ